MGIIKNTAIEIKKLSINISEKINSKNLKYLLRIALWSLFNIFFIFVSSI